MKNDKKQDIEIKSFSDIAEIWKAMIEAIESISLENAYAYSTVKGAVFKLRQRLEDLPSDEDFKFPYDDTIGWEVEYSSNPNEYIEKMVIYEAVYDLDEDLTEYLEQRCEHNLTFFVEVQQKLDGARMALAAMLYAVADKLDRPQAALMARTFEQQGRRQ